MEPDNLMGSDNLIEKKIFCHKRTKKRYKIIKINRSKNVIFYQDVIDNSIIKKETVYWFLLNMTEPYIP
jgi:hypothetical protein